MTAKDPDRDSIKEEGTMTEGQNGEVGQEGRGESAHDDSDRDDLADAVDDRAVGTSADGVADTPESVAGTDEPMVDDGLR